MTPKDLETLRKMLEKKAAYDPPYGVEHLKKHYPQLLKDPTHKWRAETGTELMHKEPTREEFERIWANWQQMTPEQKRISDQMAKKLTGMTNAEVYKKFKDSYLEKKAEKSSGLGRVHNITNDDAAVFGHLPFSRFHKSWKRKIVVAKNGDLAGHVAYEPETSELKGLWVHPKYRRQGVATKLIKSLPKHVTSLNVLKSNEAAKSLYEGLGFKVTGPGKGNWGSHPRSERMEKKASKLKSTATEMYHGSPLDLNELKRGPKSQGIFLTRHKGIASLFIPSKKDIPGMDQYSSINFGYREWGKKEQGAPHSAITITHNAKGLPPVSGTSKGYIYTVHVDPKVLEKFKNNPGSSDREMVHPARRLPVVTKEPHTVNWTAVFSPARVKRYGPALEKKAAIKPGPTIPGSVGAWAEALKQRKYIQMKLR